MAASGWTTGLLLTGISRPSCSFSKSLGHCGVWQQHTVQAGSHLHPHMTPLWLRCGLHSQTPSGVLRLLAGQGSELLLHSSQRDRLLHEQTTKHGFDLKSSSQSNLTKKKINKRNVHILLTQDPLEVTASVGLASDITQHSSVLNLKVFLL